MALDYTEFVALARELIADAGRVVTFQQLSGTPDDEDRPWRGPAEPTVALSVDAPAAFVPPSGADLGAMSISEEMLRRASQVCLVAPTADAFNFEAAHAILDGDVRWGVQWVAKLAPGPLPVLYAVGVSR